MPGGARLFFTRRDRGDGGLGTPWLDDEEEDLFGDGIVGTPFQDTASRDITGLLVRIAIPLAILGLLWLLLLAIWNLGLAKLTPVERAYAKMSRLGSMAGVRRGPHQTPVEYAQALASVLPAIGSAAQQIGWAFSVRRYSRSEEAGEETEEVERAWKEIRGRLFGRALSRLVPVSSSRRA